MPAAPLSFALIRDLAASWDEVAGLAAAHYRELAHWPDIAFSPDRERYLAIATAGALRVFGAWDGTVLAGYSSYVVAPSLHQSYSLQARHDALYLSPTYRGAGQGRGLIRHCNQALKAEGVQVVFMSSHVHHPIGALLQRCGFEPVDTDYALRLDRVA